jgi:hypothetical protein
MRKSRKRLTNLPSPLAGEGSGKRGVDLQTPPFGCHRLADSAAIGLRSRGRCLLPCRWPSPVAACVWRQHNERAASLCWGDKNLIYRKRS